MKVIQTVLAVVGAVICVVVVLGIPFLIFGAQVHTMTWECWIVVAAAGAVVAAVAVPFCVWELARLRKVLVRESSKTQALLAEIRDRLGK